MGLLLKQLLHSHVLLVSGSIHHSFLFFSSWTVIEVWNRFKELIAPIGSSFETVVAFTCFVSIWINTEDDTCGSFGTKSIVVHEVCVKVYCIHWIDLTDGFLLFTFIFPVLGLSQRYGIYSKDWEHPLGLPVKQLLHSHVLLVSGPIQSMIHVDPLDEKVTSTFTLRNKRKFDAHKSLLALIW